MYLLGSERISAPRVVVSIRTLSTSSGFILCSFMVSRTAVIGWCVNASVGNALYSHSVMRNFLPNLSVRIVLSHFTLFITSNTPSLPSKSFTGPENPVSANMAALTPASVAMGSAVFFMLVRAPATTPPRVK